MPYPVIPDVPANQAAPIDGQKATYSASITGLVPASSATDLFTITGSSTKTLRITYLEISGTQTTAGDVDMVVLKRSTADSGGTSTNPTAVPHDSSSAAATATLNAYTANPTIGTLVGSLRVAKLFVATATADSDNLTLDYGKRPEQAIVLRGATQVLAVNLGGTTVTGGSFDINVTWTEE